MPNQTIGYYSSRKKKLLEDFDRNCTFMKDHMTLRYGEELTCILLTEMRKEFNKLIPEIPFIKGIRARFLNTFLIITAQELAVYKAMHNHGKPPSEAWECCHQAIRLIVETVPKWKRLIWKRLMFSNFVKKIIARRESTNQKGLFGDFEIKYLVGKGDDFDIGANYHDCGNYKFAIKHGGAAFAPYICMSDIALSDALEWGLTRTQTLADGCSYCDFRFKKGTATNISSKTPEVQDTITKIHASEIQRNIETLAS